VVFVVFKSDVSIFCCHCALAVGKKKKINSEQNEKKYFIEEMESLKK
jgi:hypothetical protein